MLITPFAVSLQTDEEEYHIPKWTNETTWSSEWAEGEFYKSEADAMVGADKCRKVDLLLLTSDYSNYLF